MKLTQVADAMSGKIAKWLKKILGRYTPPRSIEQAQCECETALDAVQDLIFIHDADLCVVRANRAYAVRAGKDIRDIIGKPYWRLFPKLDGPLPVCRQSLEENQCGEEELHLDSGEEYVSRTYPIYDAEGKYLHSLHVMQDVTEKRRAEGEQRTLSKALHDSESMYRLLTEDTRDVLWKADPHFCMTYISPADEYLRGFKAAEVVGHPAFEMFTEEGVAIVNNIIKKNEVSRQSGTFAGHLTFEVPHRCKDGQVLWGEVVSKPEFNAQGEIVGYHGITREITERKRMEEQLNASLAEKEALVQSLNELSTLDGLTGLYNHRTFYTLIEDELARARRFDRPASLLLLDIDHFKHVNDTYGHQAGDAVLKGLSELLGRQVRAIDRVCRYGGEEITIILPEIDLEAATNIAERLRAAVETQTFDINSSKPLRITVSIGVASYPAHADNVQALVAAADAAMYEAKRGGRNRIIRYEPALGHAATSGRAE